MSTMTRLFRLYVFVSVLIAVASQCPDGWMNHGTMCYHFSHDLEDWIDAQVLCEHFGATLAEIHSQYEDNFLTQEAVRRNGIFWIGATDLMVEGEWRWYSENSPLSYNNWGPHEPTNGGGKENCAEIRGPYSNWNDNSCSAKQWYICQKKRDDGSVVIG